MAVGTKESSEFSNALAFSPEILGLAAVFSYI